MSATQKLLQFFAVPNDPELVQAQARAFSRQIPLLYGNVVVNTLLLSATVTAAPPLLRLYIPGLLTLLCIVRMATWLRARQTPAYTQARRLLVSAVVASGILGLAFTAWALSLYSYGDPFQQAHIAFYIALTSICGIFSLMHLRAAAVIMALSMLAPFAVFFMTSGNAVLVAVAVTLTMTVTTLLWILFANYRDFGEFVASRSEMASRQAETQRLSDENYQLANVDALTGLPNRRSFDRQLQAMLTKAHAGGYQIAVARLDLDSFKSINDIFGQITGDRVLTEVARRINGIRRPSSLLARLGADNFALILGGPTDEANLRACGEELTRAMRLSFDLTGANIHLSASAGFASSRPGDTAETLFAAPTMPPRWPSARNGAASLCFPSGMRSTSAASAAWNMRCIPQTSMQKSTFSSSRSSISRTIARRATKCWRGGAARCWARFRRLNSSPWQSDRV